MYTKSAFFSLASFAGVAALLCSVVFYSIVRPWERAPEREPSLERMSMCEGSDTGGEGPTRDRPAQRAPTQRGPDTQRERPTQGARPTQETHRQ